jgi:Leucine-rich repeat (LRR) protein
MIKMKRITSFALAIVALALISAESGNKPEAALPDDPADVAVVRDKWGAGRVITDPHGSVAGLCAVPDDLVGDPELQRAISRLHHVRFLGSKGTKGLDLLLGAMASSKTLESTDLLGVVTDDALAKLENVQSLVHISIAADGITDAAFGHLGKLRNLNWIAVGAKTSNGRLEIDGRGLKDLSGLKKLETLYLLECPIDDAGIANLKGLNLKEIQLRYPAITARGIEAISGMTSLERLGISNAHITDKAFAHIGRLKNLKSVSLDHCGKLNGSELGKLAALQNLTFLCLQDCPINDAAMKNLKGLRLRALNLRQTNITDQGIDELKGMTTLHALYVGNTKVTKAVFTKLKDIKDLEIIRVRDDKTP